MAYTANEYIAIATAKSPLGPFTQTEKVKLPTDTHQIDPFVFFDDDGKTYLYHVRLEHGNRIYVAEMNKDLRSIKKETLTPCIIAGDAPLGKHRQNRMDRRRRPHRHQTKRNLRSFLLG